MAKRLLDVDPLTGTKTYHEYDHATRQTHITESQDVSRYLRYAKERANDSAYKQAGIKNDMYHFARVPNSVIMELKTKYGLDVFQKDDLPKIEKVLARDYKALLTVNKI